MVRPLKHITIIMIINSLIAMIKLKRYTERYTEQKFRHSSLPRERFCCLATSGLRCRKFDNVVIYSLSLESFSLEDLGVQKVFAFFLLGSAMQPDWLQTFRTLVFYSNIFLLKYHWRAHWCTFNLVLNWMLLFHQWYCREELNFIFCFFIPAEYQWYRNKNRWKKGPINGWYWREWYILHPSKNKQLYSNWSCCRALITYAAATSPLITPYALITLRIGRFVWSVLEE